MVWIGREYTDPFVVLFSDGGEVLCIDCFEKEVWERIAERKGFISRLWERELDIFLDRLRSYEYSDLPGSPSSSRLRIEQARCRLSRLLGSGEIEWYTEEIFSSGWDPEVTFTAYCDECNEPLFPAAQEDYFRISDACERLPELWGEFTEFWRNSPLFSSPGWNFVDHPSEKAPLEWLRENRGEVCSFSVREERILENSGFGFADRIKEYIFRTERNDLVALAEIVSSTPAYPFGGLYFWVFGRGIQEIRSKQKRIEFLLDEIGALLATISEYGDIPEYLFNNFPSDTLREIKQFQEDYDLELFV